MLRPSSSFRLAVSLLLFLVVGFASANFDVAYARISLNVRYGGTADPSFTLDASLYPRITASKTCNPWRCVTGLATPVGYAYDPLTFADHPNYHAEEIHHLRQWEALGPAYLLAYIMTGGEAFEPYDARGAFPANSDAPHWSFDRMWVPPADLEGRFPQLRITWGDAPDVKLFPGYGSALADLATHLLP